jgi:hypothetical protein
MTMHERDEMRELQDKVVARLKKRFPDFPEDAGIFIDRDPNPTIQTLREQIYPQYRHLLEDLLKL